MTRPTPDTRPCDCSPVPKTDTPGWSFAMNAGRTLRRGRGRPSRPSGHGPGKARRSQRVHPRARGHRYLATLPALSEHFAPGNAAYAGDGFHHHSPTSRYRYASHGCPMVPRRSSRSPRNARTNHLDGEPDPARAEPRLATTDTDMLVELTPDKARAVPSPLPRSPTSPISPRRPRTAIAQREHHSRSNHTRPSSIGAALKNGRLASRFCA
jgi:hypothetical protein